MSLRGGVSNSGYQYLLFPWRLQEKYVQSWRDSRAFLFPFNCLLQGKPHGLSSYVDCCNDVLSYRASRSNWHGSIIWVWWATCLGNFCRICKRPGSALLAGDTLLPFPPVEVLSRLNYKMKHCRAGSGMLFGFSKTTIWLSQRVWYQIND